MPLQRRRDLLHGIQPTADHPGVPTVEEPGSPASGRVGPEVSKVLLDRPRPTGLQVGSLNRQHLERGICIEVLYVVEVHLVDVPGIVQTEQVTVVLVEIVRPASIRKPRKNGRQPRKPAKNPKMKHPVTGEAVQWSWGVDFFHACEYVS